jgi:hypothetical protein
LGKKIRTTGSVVDPGCLFRVSDLVFFHPGSKNTNKKGKNVVVFFSHKFHKI